MEANHSGIVLGGALGHTSSYIDLIIFDGDNSLKLIETFIKEKDLINATSIQFFAAGKEGRRTFL